MMARGFRVIAFCIHVATLVLCGFLIWRSGLSYKEPVGTLEYKDLIAIILSALGVMIAILAALVAIAAVWGFKQIQSDVTEAARNMARQIAETEARKVAEQTATRVSTELGNQKSSGLGDDYGRAAGSDNEKS
jgi:hypothetical protein